MFRAIETGASLNLGAVVSALGAGVVVRNRSLTFLKHVDAEALLGVEMGVGACGMIHADQDEHGIERDRGEGVGRHTMNLTMTLAFEVTLDVDRDDRHPGGETAHSCAEFGSVQTHVGNARATDYITTPRP
jgi:hypothetical protein